MNLQLLNKPQRWRNAGRRDSRPEAFLREREPFCVAACGRFLHRSFLHDHVWVLQDGKGKVEALLIHSKRSFFPVFNGLGEIPVPRFLNRLVRNIPIHAVQGLREDVIILENSIAHCGVRPVESFDYDLMSLDREPAADCFKVGPGGKFRRPDSRDMADLLPLQAGYEQEEVLPRGAVFDPASSRAALEHILAHEHILGAELDGRIIAKANTSAKSFTRYQIGGVYVHPDYRGRGIATRLCAELFRDLLLTGKGLSLFVKKQNPAARSVYRSLGFEFLADYRISYY